jgi:hypothetical protein
MIDYLSGKTNPSMSTLALLLAWPIDFQMHCAHVLGECIITDEGLLRVQATSHLVLAWVVDGVLISG